MERPRLYLTLFAIGLCLLVGASASWFTHQSVNSWYVLLNKPALTPPNWLFPVVWTLLYIMMGVAWATVLSQKIATYSKINASTAFLTQLGLNFFWSLFFFYKRDPFFSSHRSDSFMDRHWGHDLHFPALLAAGGRAPASLLGLGRFCRLSQFSHLDR